jgi:AcrR family transcriptional regulator
VSVRDRWGEPQQRAIAAARALAEEGGYDAVQIRNVVARTGLSTATIYRHFSSKDHLIAAAQLEWTRSLPDTRRRLPAGGTAADRVVELVHRTCTAFGRSPNLGKALMLTLGSPDPGVRECLAEADELVLRTVREAIGDELPDPEVVLGPLGIAWHGALLAWAHDHMALEEVDALLQRTIRLLFAGALAGAGAGAPDATPTT